MVQKVMIQFLTLLHRPVAVMVGVEVRQPVDQVVQAVAVAQFCKAAVQEIHQAHHQAKETMAAAVITTAAAVVAVPLDQVDQLGPKVARAVQVPHQALLGLHYFIQAAVAVADTHHQRRQVDQVWAVMAH